MKRIFIDFNIGLYPIIMQWQKKWHIGKRKQMWRYKIGVIIRLGRGEEDKSREEGREGEGRREEGKHKCYHSEG